MLRDIVPLLVNNPNTNKTICVMFQLTLCDYTAGDGETITNTNYYL